MEVPQPERGRFHFETRRQERIYRRLSLVGPGPASFYRDACRLMVAEPPYEATTHAVAHLLREIESALCAVLIPFAEPLEDESANNDKKHRAKIRAILNGLNIPESDPVAQAWLKLPGRNNPYGLAARAHRENLAPPRSLDKEFLEFWEEMEAILDVVLAKFEARYLEVHRTLDQLLEKASPIGNDIKTLRQYVPNNPVAFDYFFGNLSSPEWLEPLHDAGFFRHPSAPRRNEEEGTVSFPPWPQSGYLARMASHDPETVLEIVLEIPETDNVNVHNDLAAAALAMPAELAARIAERETEWIRLQQQLYFQLPQTLGDLVVHLADEEQVDQALRLAEALLAVRSQAQTEEEGPYQFPALLARTHEWEYEQILQSIRPALVDAAGESALELLCDLLENAIRFLHDNPHDEGPEDYSRIWRPRIQEPRRHTSHKLRALLVSAVRDAGEQLADTDPSLLRNNVHSLEGRQWRIFHRLVLYLLSKFPEAAPELVAERLTNREYFDDFSLRHEYDLLAAASFADLAEGDKETILEWIEEGPEVESFRARYEEHEGESPPDKAVAEYANRWRRERLAPFAEALPEEWQQRYNSWISEYGAPQRPDYTPSVVWAGPTSPVSIDELGAMSMAEIVELLAVWQPSGDPMQPSREGLSRELKELVAEEPQRFAEQADHLKTLDPTYVQGIISGFREAVENEHAFPWDPVLDLSRWIVEQPQEPDSDPDLSWVRQTIAELLSGGFERNSAQIPFDLRDDAWNVLRVLTMNSIPTPAYEVQYGGSNMDPTTLSLNTTRGQAMHAVMRYALWVHHNIEHSAGPEEGTKGFDKMPEMRDVLEAHLAPETDPSVAIRSVYGQWFPTLVFLDKTWTEQHVRNIFPSEADQRQLYAAAWNAYITFNRPYSDVLDVLEGTYRREVNQTGGLPDDVDDAFGPHSHLAHHLMIYYWSGQLDLEDRGGLLAQFYTHAPDALRAHALAYAGRALGNTGEVSTSVLDRLRALWMSRVEAVRDAGSPDEYTQELAAFGWWFISGKFDDSWAMAQLKAALELGGWIEPTHLVVDHLVQKAAELPLLAAENLGLIIEGEGQHQGLYAWRQSAREVIELVLSSENERAQRAARELVNRLAARGINFQDLLS